MSDECEERKRAFYVSKLPCSQGSQSIIFGVYRIRNGRFLCWFASANMVWDFMSTRGVLVAKMVIYVEDWKVFSHIQDVFEKLDKQNNIWLSPEQFKRLLLECGFNELDGVC
jgi:hypothetical protein